VPRIRATLQLSACNPDRPIIIFCIRPNSGVISGTVGAVPVTPSGQSSWTWAAGTSDPRALLTGPGATDRVASTWYSSSPFTVDVNLTDGRAHRMSLYLLDWDSTQRSERIDVIDPATGNVLDSQTASSFHGGEYLSWALSGHVVLRITPLSGMNAVLSGLFFDPQSGPASGTTAAFVGADTTTQGDWPSAYGRDIYDVIGGTSGPPNDGAADGMPYQVTVTATDGTETSERSFQWSVNPTTLPTIALANPGDQTNRTNDLISLQIRATTSNSVDTSELQYAADGLPVGITIDPSTGLISGLANSWWDVPGGRTYPVTVSVTDGYGRTMSQSFAWHFTPPASTPSAPNSSPASGGTRSGPAPAGQPNGLLPPANHPTTEARSDRFDNELFWQDVELYPGGIAAETWLANKHGQVEWAWAGITTVGTYARNAGGDLVPFVYIPKRYNEADAARAFIQNIQYVGVTGWGAESKIPDSGDIDGWRDYLKQIHSEQFAFVSGAAQAALAAATIVNEGADWAVNLNDLQNAKTFREAALASICFLPIVSGSVIKVFGRVDGVAKELVELTAKEAMHIRTMKSTFENSKAFGSLSSN